MKDFLKVNFSYPLVIVLGVVHIGLAQLLECVPHHCWQSLQCYPKAISRHFVSYDWNFIAMNSQLPPEPSFYTNSINFVNLNALCKNRDSVFVSVTGSCSSLLFCCCNKAFWPKATYMRKGLFGAHSQITVHCWGKSGKGLFGAHSQTTVHHWGILGRSSIKQEREAKTMEELGLSACSQDHV